MTASESRSGLMIDSKRRRFETEIKSDFFLDVFTDKCPIVTFLPDYRRFTFHGTVYGTVAILRYVPTWTV